MLRLPKKLTRNLIYSPQQLKVQPEAQVQGPTATATAATSSVAKVEDSPGTIVYCGLLQQLERTGEWERKKYHFLYSDLSLRWGSEELLHPPKGMYLMVKSFKKIPIQENDSFQFIVRGILQPGPGVPIKLELSCRSRVEQSAWLDSLKKVTSRERLKSPEPIFRIEREGQFKPLRKFALIPGKPGYYANGWPKFMEDERG